MDSAKQEPAEISWMTNSNLLELDGSDVIYQEQEESTENDPVKPYVKRNRYVCRKCGQKFAERKDKKIHEKNWSKRLCEICDEEFQCSFGLIQHIRRDHANEFGCRKCPYVGKNLKAFRAHSKRMHTAPTSLEMSDTHKYACSKCGLEFKTRKDFREHQSQMGNFKCLFCNEEFECEHAKSQHLERDHDKKISQLSTLQQKESSKLETFDVEMKFECDHCGLSFDKKSKLIIHVKSVHVKFVTSCEECGARSRDINLTRHRKKYSGNFKCSRKNCGKVFKCKRALNIHIRKDHEEICKCPECPAVFKTKRELRNHQLRIQHNNKFQCDICELSFLQEKGLQFHKWYHHKFSCAKCEKKFETLNDLKKHEIKAHPNQQTKNKQISVDSNGIIVPKQDPVKPHVKRNRYVCRKCGQKFVDREGLKRHEKVWSKLTCDVCDEEFQCKFGLSQHMLQNHEKNLKCRKCSFVGKYLEALKTHCKKIHKAQSVVLQTSLEISYTHNKYACSKCGLEFGTRKDFRGHQSQIGNFKCLLCDEEFECEYARSQHLGRDHEKEISQLSTLQQTESSKLDVEKKFECDHCGLTFDKRRKLVCHMLDHLKSAFSCDYCGTRFSRLISLTSHRKNYSGNFKCSRKNCNKVFKCKRALKIHARDEHEQNWKCPECPKILKSRKSLKSHLNYNHKNLRDNAKPLWISKNPKMENQCNQCQLTFASKALLKFHISKHKLHDAAMEALVFSCKKCGTEFESHKDLSLHQTIADEYNCAFWNEKYDFKHHSMVTSNQQEMTSENNQRHDQRLETVVKDEQEENPLVTETLSMKIPVKEEPEVSYVLKLPSE